MEVTDSERDSGDEEFSVECIRDCRINDGIKEYFLKWLGYPDEENTWEPEDNLQCPEMIAEFNKQYTLNEERKKKEGQRIIDSGQAQGISDALLNNEHPSLENSPNVMKLPQDEKEKKKKKKADKIASKFDKPSTSEVVSSTKRPKEKFSDFDEKATDVKKIKLPKKPRKLLSLSDLERLEVEKILGITKEGDENLFFIEWKDSGVADLVPARIANIKFPQEVIQFYQERLTWTGELFEDT